jgi:hypothetical protein
MEGVWSKAWHEEPTCPINRAAMSVAPSTTKGPGILLEPIIDGQEWSGDARNT